MFLFGNKEKTCEHIPLDAKGRRYVNPMQTNMTDEQARLVARFIPFQERNKTAPA